MIGEIDNKVDILLKCYKEQKQFATTAIEILEQFKKLKIKSAEQEKELDKLYKQQVNWEIDQMEKNNV